MSLLTVEDFKDRSIDPNWSAFDMLLEVAEVAALKCDQEHADSVPCIPKKPNLVSKIEVNFHQSPKETEEGEAREVSKHHGLPKEKAPQKPIRLGKEFMDFDIGGALRNAVTKIGKQPTISETESYAEEDDQAMGLRNKRRRATLLDDDEEWAPEKPFKKQKKSSKSTKRDNSPCKLKHQLPLSPEPQPDLPQEFKNKISEIGGNSVTLVIQKKLFSTDLSLQHNRLSMPLKQIKNADFLREEELQVLLEKQTIEVPLIQPSLEVTNITLARWDMAKASGSTSSCYVLRTSWKIVAAANELKQNDTVQIWSFRVQEKLCMALVKL